MLQKNDWYSRPEFLNAQRMQNSWQRWQTVTQRQVNPRIVQCEHKTHLLPCRQAAKGDCGASLAVVYTLGYQMITLKRNTENCNQDRLLVENHRTLVISWPPYREVQNPVLSRSTHREGENTVIRSPTCRKTQKLRYGGILQRHHTGIMLYRVYQNECRDMRHLQVRNENRYDDVGICSIIVNSVSFTKVARASQL
jgi:hypothetical protein